MNIFICTSLEKLFKRTRRGMALAVAPHPAPHPAPKYQKNKKIS